MLNLIVVLVIAFPGWLLRRAIGYVIGFRGGRPLLERTGRTQKLRLKTIDKGEKLFERFTRLGALAAPEPVSRNQEGAGSDPRICIYSGTSTQPCSSWTCNPLFFAREKCTTFKTEHNARITFLKKKGNRRRA